MKARDVKRLCDPSRGCYIADLAAAGVVAVDPITVQCDGASVDQEQRPLWGVPHMSCGARDLRIAASIMRRAGVMLLALLLWTGTLWRDVGGVLLLRKHPGDTLL